MTDAALTGVSRSVTLGSDPDRLPGENDQWAMGEVNGGNEYMTYAEWQPDLIRDEVTVRGGWHDVGVLEFAGVPPQKQEFVEFAVPHFSQKKVRFRR